MNTNFRPETYAGLAPSIILYPEATKLEHSYDK